MKTLKIFLAAVMVLSLALFAYPAYAGKSYMTGRTVSVKSGDNGREDGEKFTTQGFTKPSAMAVNIYGINTNAVAPDQTTNYNCAAFSLAALFADKGVSMDDISAALKPYTNEQGYTSLEGLQIVANQLGEKYGLDYEAVKTSFPNLVNDTDAIVHFSYGHYVKLVSYDESSGIVSYKDNGELKTATRDEFESQFSGYALVNKSKADDKDVISNNEAAGVFGAKNSSSQSSGGGNNGGASVTGGSAGKGNGNANSFSSGGGGSGRNGGVSFGASSSAASAALASFSRALAALGPGFSGLSASLSSASRSLGGYGGSSISNPSFNGRILGEQGLISGPNLTAQMRSLGPQWSSSNVNGGNPNFGFAKSGLAAGGAGGLTFNGGKANLVFAPKDVADSLNRDSQAGLGLKYSGLKYDQSWGANMISQARDMGLKLSDSGQSFVTGDVAVSSPALTGTIKVGEIKGKVEQIGDRINVYETVGIGDYSQRNLVMAGTVDKDGNYTLYSVGKDGKPTGDIISSGNWTGKVAENIEKSMYDPGHLIINSENGEKTDIDLSDNSYVITKGNQQVASGSANALNHSNLQVYATIFEAGYSIPTNAARLLAGMPGKPTEWNYESSKDQIDFYKNNFTGQTIQLVNDNPEASSQYSWKDSQGNTISQVNLELPVSAQETASLMEKFDPNYGKYETTTTQAERNAQRLGLNPDPKTSDEVENYLKSLASQSGYNVKAIVSSGGVKYMAYSYNDSGELAGARVYDFQHDDPLLPAGNIVAYDYKAGQFVEAGRATIAKDGTVKEVTPAQVANTVANEELVITPIKDPRDVDPYYYIRNHNNTSAVNKDGSAESILAAVPLLGLTDIATGKSDSKVQENQDPAGYQLVKDFARSLTGSVVDIIKATSFFTQGQNAAVEATTPGVNAPSAQGFQESGWKTDPLGYLLSGVSDTEQRGLEVIGATLNSVPGADLVKTVLGPVVSDPTVNSNLNILTQTFGVTIKPDLGQASADLSEKMIAEFSPTHPSQEVSNALQEIGPQNLDRFSQGTLETLVDTKLNPDKYSSRPLAVVVAPLNDENGAFYTDTTGAHVRDLIAHGFRVEYYQVATDVQAIDAIKKATVYGADPAEVILIEGHGQQNLVDFGSPLLFGVGQINLYGDKAALASLRPSLKEGGKVVTYSCHVGEGEESKDNMVNFLADVFPQAGNVYGAEGAPQGMAFKWEGNNIAEVIYGGVGTFDAQRYNMVVRE